MHNPEWRKCPDSASWTVVHKLFHTQCTSSDVLSGHYVVVHFLHVLENEDLSLAKGTLSIVLMPLLMGHLDIDKWPGTSVSENCPVWAQLKVVISKINFQKFATQLAATVRYFIQCIAGQVLAKLEKCTFCFLQVLVHPHKPPRFQNSPLDQNYSRKWCAWADAYLTLLYDAILRLCIHLIIREIKRIHLCSMSLGNIYIHCLFYKMYSINRPIKCETCSGKASKDLHSQKQKCL